MTTANTSFKSSELLTKRQNQIAILRCDGLSYCEIAAQLNIETRTVESHLNAIRVIIDAKDSTIEFLCRCIILGIYSKERLLERYNF